VALIAVSTDADHYDELYELARSGDDDLWTMPKGAKPGDQILFYITRPFADFVAWAEVTSDTGKGLDPNWPDDYSAKVSDVRLLPRPIPRLKMLDMVPGWKWPKGPERGTIIPADVEKQVRRAAGI
jgi:hypothetical protein